MNVNIIANNIIYEKSFTNQLVLDEFLNKPVIYSINDLTEDTKYSVSNISFKVFNKVSVRYYATDSLIIISNDKDKATIYNEEINGSIIINTFLKKISVDSDITLFHNFKKTKGVFDFKNFDEIYINDNLKIKFIKAKLIEVSVYGKLEITTSLSDVTNIYETNESNIYTNSPRVVNTVEEVEIELKKPTEDSRENKFSEVLKRIIPTIITASLTLVMAIFIPRGPYVLIALATTVVTVIFTIIKYFNDKKENNTFNAKRDIVYNNYINELTKELNKAQYNEFNARNYNDPNYDTIYNYIINSSERLYERDSSSGDFLNVRVGVRDQSPKYTLKLDIDLLAIEKNELEKHIEELYEEFKTVSDAPYVLDLNSDNLGLVGKHELVNIEIHKIVANIFFNHSYHDVRFVFIVSEADLKEFRDYRFLPHTKHSITDMSSIIYDESSRDSILGSYMSLFRAREQMKDTMFLPNIIFVITNYELLNNHPILEFLLKDKKDYGFTVIESRERREELSANIKNVIIYNNSYNGIVKLNNGKLVDEELKLEQVTNKLHSEVIIRKLAKLEHTRGVSSSLPERLGFLEMFEVTTPEQLKIKNRWQTNKSYKSLAVRLGKKTKHEYQELNLHEKAHGPHGLIAGTTGSGKSEVIQSYILSLAVNFSPEEVGFLLIDYKGGGMANLFNNLPHLLGTITNLDGYQSMRALASIKSELKRRQRLFSDTDVNHINDYHKLFENKIVSEPLPHLFLISDEFAELKSEQPEFMKELVSAARIGRSLGIHLILATQKPSGVVDDQIWSNSKFKLSLKVAEEADSRELLKTTDAAYIKEPGRGYLKVGTNEEYVLFQSAYSGADYVSESERVKDRRIYKLDSNFNKMLINEDLSKEVSSAINQSELDAIVNHIKEEYSNSSLTSVPAPWLPPLNEHISEEIIISSDNDNYDFELKIGLVDLPDRQAQSEYSLNLLKNQIVGIFGESRQGKTSLITKMLLEMSAVNSSRNLKYFIIDLANSGLLPLSALKHTAEYVRINDEEKFDKLIKMLRKEINMRREKLEEKLMSNYEQYVNAGYTDLPLTVLVIENYAIAKEISMNFADDIMKISRDGKDLGISTITSSVSMNSIKVAAQSLYTEKIHFYTDDKTQLSQTVGRVENLITETPGRAYVRLDKPEVMQIYDYTSLEMSTERLTYTNELINQINEVNDYQNVGIPEMPKVVSYLKPNSSEHIYLGKEYEEVADVFIKVNNLLIGGKENEAKNDVISKVVKELSDNHEVFVFSKKNQDFSNVENIKNINENYLEYFNSVLDFEDNEEAFLEFLEESGLPLNKAKVEFENNNNNNNIKRALVISSNECFDLLTLEQKNIFIKKLEEVISCNIKLIVSIENSGKADELTKLVKDFEHQIIIGQPTNFNFNYNKYEKIVGSLGKDDIIHFYDGEMKKIRRHLEYQND